MSKRRRERRASRGSRDAPSARPATPVGNWRGAVLWAAVLLTVAALAAGIGLRRRSRAKVSAELAYAPRPRGVLTFSKDIAPILFQHCSGCHRPGQSGPFSLLNYADARKHATEIARVTASRYMPPWPPEPGYGEFAESRRLSLEALGMLQQWIAEGIAEGRPADLPPLPQWAGGWQLGQPDLVVQAPAYTLPAEGKDLYRHFVVPIPTTARRFVEGVEFLPGNPKVVHHAFVEIDRTRRARRLAERQNPPGFDGMEAPETVVMPGGQLLGWQPGKTPYLAPPGLAWVLETNTDLVLQVHMNPSGKPEVVQPTVGFHFTAEPPTNSPYRLRLTVLNLDIPPGASNYVAEESYVTPVALSLVRVTAHAHHLGKDLQGYALLPNGKQAWLLRIKDWDFNRQGDYRYAQPVELPKGARIVLHYSYDNSTNNVRNPNHPPKRVRFGPQTVDEMGALTFQALPRDLADYAILAKDYAEYFARVSLEHFAFRVANNPDDTEAHKRLGRALGARGQVAEGIAHLMKAVELDPAEDEAHYDLGSLFLRAGRHLEAEREFREVVRLNPQDFEALGSLGILCLRGNRPAEAEGWFKAALRVNPDDTRARQYLGAIQGRPR